MESIKVPLQVHVKYDTKVGKHLSDYHDIRGQIMALIVMSKYYSRKLKSFNEKYTIKPESNRIIEEDDMLPVTGTFVNIVMSYNRCFDTSGGKKKSKENRRRIKLHDDFLKKADQSILDTHHALKNLRDKVIAHAGKNDYEKHEFKISFDSNGHLYISPANDNVYFLASNEVEFDKMEPLLDVVLKEVNIKINGLMEIAQKELNILNERKEKVIDKLQSGQPVTDEDLRKE